MELRYLAKALTDHLLPTTLVDASVDAPTKRLVTTMLMQSWIMTMALAFPLQMANVTATATWKTLSASAEVHVQLTLTQMAFATTLTTAWVQLDQCGVATETTLLALDATVFQVAVSNLTIAVCVAVTTAAAQVAWMKQPATMTQTLPFKDCDRRHGIAPN